MDESVRRPNSFLEENIPSALVRFGIHEAMRAGS